MKIAAEIAGFFKLNFNPVILDENYARKNFWDHGLEFLKKSFGLGNLSRAHYHYILNCYLRPYRYLLTGNFGSEILRSVRIPGVVTSSALFKSFAPRTTGDLYNDLMNEQGLSYLNTAVINENLANIVGEIEDYLGRMPSGLSVNQKFYTYIFEEVFRKYFGPEIIVQRTSVNHRAPFLCFSFIEKVLQTGFAGANSGFVETNPIKRFRGHILYASMIEKTNPALLNIRLTGGYKPKDLLTKSGTIRIAIAYLKRKYSGNRKQIDPDYITLSLAGNISQFPDIRADDDIFNSNFLGRMKSGGWFNDQMNFMNIMSAVIFRNMLDGKSGQE
jgi:hypothetical protein